MIVYTVGMFFGAFCFRSWVADRPFLCFTKKEGFAHLSGPCFGDFHCDFTVGMPPPPFRIPPSNTTNIGRIERGFVVMGCVLDVVRGYYAVLNECIQKGPGTFLHPSLPSSCIFPFVFAFLPLDRHNLVHGRSISRLCLWLPSSLLCFSHTPCVCPSLFLVLYRRYSLFRIGFGVCGLPCLRGVVSFCTSASSRSASFATMVRL